MNLVQTGHFLGMAEGEKKDGRAGVGEKLARKRFVASSRQSLKL